MKTNEVILNICERAASLVEKDLNDWIVPQLSVSYQQYTDKLAARVYGSGSNQVARNAFRESCKHTLFKGTNTFLFVKEHWRNGRDLNVYLMTCLKRFADQTFWDLNAAKRSNTLVCPACREIGTKFALVKESKSWRCNNCTRETERIAHDLRKGKIKENDLTKVRTQLRLHKLFALHTRRGFRCPEPDCNRFIPESINGQYGIECPYADCGFFGNVDSLEEMAHPSMAGQRIDYSLNQQLNSNPEKESGATLQDVIEAQLVTAEEKIAINQTFNQEYRILLSTIDSSIQSIKRNSDAGAKFQKLVMYEAFRNMSVQNPEEMISYLVHRRQSADVPIQARIFQEFVRLMENELPMEVKINGETVDILSITAPELGIFTGTSVFTARVEADGIIPNHTVETYTGSRKYKMFGPCFLGKVVKLVDRKTGKNLINSMKSHSFAQIDTNLPEGLEVEVTHFRLPSHYELGCMVKVQRVRKHLVERIQVHVKKNDAPKVPLLQKQFLVA